MEALCYHPDMAMPWIGPAVAATVATLAQRPASVLWATAGPVSSFVVARRAAQLTGIPYVLDFRDAWTITFNDFEARRPAWAVRADRRRFHNLLKGARAITFRYHAEAECFWRAYPGALDARRIHILPNGFDGPIDTSLPPGSDRCRVLYAGTLSSYRYDTVLLRLQKLYRTTPRLADRLRLLFVGEGCDKLAAMRPLWVFPSGQRSRQFHESSATNCSATLMRCLVLGRPSTVTGHELFAGAKLFGYLQAGRPILGVLPRDETRRILEGLGVSTIADADSPDQIAALAERVADAWAHGTLQTLAPDAAACQAYSAERQAHVLELALSDQPAHDPFVPHRVEVPSHSSIACQSVADEDRRGLLHS